MIFTLSIPRSTIYGPSFGPRSVFKRIIYSVLKKSRGLTSNLRAVSKIVLCISSDDCSEVRFCINQRSDSLYSSLISAVIGSEEDKSLDQLKAKPILVSRV